MIDHSENQYALNIINKKRVSVFDVPTGEKCNCICSVCKEPVGAKNEGKTRDSILKPNQKAAHFYHVNSADSKCSGETIIHILAKEVIKETQKLVFEIPDHYSNETFIKKYSQEVLFDKVLLEQRLDINNTYIIPDVTTITKNKKLYIEIVYQNKISEFKKSLILKHKLRFLAINFKVSYINWNEFKTEPELKDKIRWFLYENDQKHQTWVFNPKFEEKESENIFISGVKSQTKNVEVNISENPVEKNYELSDSLKLRLDIEGNERKLEVYALVLNYVNTSFVSQILDYEEKWEYFMRDENFVMVDSRLQINPIIEEELLKLQKQNEIDWRYLYRSKRRNDLF